MKYSWSDFELDESTDAIPDKYILTIWEDYGDGDQSEFAIMVHRHTARNPIDGHVAAKKRRDAHWLCLVLNGVPR